MMHQLLTALLGVLLTVTSSVHGWTTYTCQMDGQTRLSCCCLVASDACATGPAQAAIGAPGCCCDVHTVTVVQPEQPTALGLIATHPTDDAHPAAVPAPAPPRFVAVARQTQRQRELSAATAHPPSYIRYCSLLT